MDKYRKIAKLGEGAHGIVFKAEIIEEEKKEDEALSTPRKRKATDAEKQDDDLDESKEKEKHYVAIKKIRLRNSREGISIEAIREIKLLQELDHPHILKVLDVFSGPNNMNVVLEYMTMDLEHIIKAKEIVLSPGAVKQYMYMILLAVQHCHDHWILHRDLKPSNLLIAADNSLKLADFGLAKIYGSPDRQLSNQACTLWYRAPELLFGARAYGQGADMWSVGCIFAELMLRAPFFPGSTELNQLSLIFHAMGTPKEEEWPGLTLLPQYMPFTPQEPRALKEMFTGASDDALDLLSAMLRFNPGKRITAKQALAHKYFTSAPPPTPLDQMPKLILKSKSNNNKDS